MWVKVCGIRETNTAIKVAACGLNAIGLNFYSPSPRSVSVADAQAIVQVLPETVTPIGLFVNHSISEVLNTCLQLKLKTVQLHGDETPDYLEKLLHHLPELQIIRAFRMGKEGISPLCDDLKQCDKRGLQLFACLIDAYVKDAYGGTGSTVAWDILKQQYNTEKRPRLILAGGLTPTNINEAIETVQPWGVDVASGVESTVGVKDISLIKQLIANINA